MRPIGKLRLGSTTFYALVALGLAACSPPGIRGVRGNQGNTYGNTTPTPSRGTVDPQFVEYVRQLMGHSMTNFGAIRVDSSAQRSQDGAGQYYDVRNLAACGPRGSYRVWHWESNSTNRWDYVCDIEFRTRAQADAMYDNMQASLLSMQEFNWQPEQPLDATTVRRTEGHGGNLYVWLDLDVEDNGVFQIEFWFKQRRAAPEIAGQQNPTYEPQQPQPYQPPAPTVAGSGLVNPEIQRLIRDLMRHSRSNFSQLIRRGTMNEDGDGDRTWRVEDSFTPCGARQNYNRVHHNRSVAGNWEYVCDAVFPIAEMMTATQYFDEMARQLSQMSEFQWEAERALNQTTTRRVEGFSENPRMQIWLDFDQEDNGTIEVELWVRQRVVDDLLNDSPTLVQPQGQGGLPQVSPSLHSQLQQLQGFARQDFRPIRAEQTGNTDSDGDTNWEVQGFQACGPQGRYNRVWRWGASGLHDYVCDVVFPGHQAQAAHRYYDDMARRLRSSLRGVQWSAETRLNATTTRRTEGYGSNPNVRIWLDFDEESNGTIEVEFWYKQNGQSQGSAGVAPTSPGGGGISGSLRQQINQLEGWSRDGFTQLRGQTTRNSDGESNHWVVSGFQACGPSGDYNRIHQWFDTGRYDYVCDAKFAGHDTRGANAYYDAFARELRRTRGWSFQRETRLNSTTTRRTEGSNNRGNRIWLDFDEESNGTIEVEFWFLGPEGGAGGGGGGYQGGGSQGSSRGRRMVSSTLRNQVSQLTRYSRSGFRAIRVESSAETDSDGDVWYDVRGFNACGTSSRYNRLLHWVADRRWDYICDLTVPQSQSDDATGYYNEMQRVLTGLRGWRWEPETRLNSNTVRRTEGWSSDRRLHIWLDYDIEDNGTIEVEFWFKQER